MPGFAVNPATRLLPLKRGCAGLPAAAEPRLQPRTARPSLCRFAAIAMMFLPLRTVTAQAVGQGFELERAGQYQRAAAVYFTTLRGDSTNLAALLGLERVLPSLNRVPDLLPVAQRAVVASPKNVALRGLLLRTYVTLNEPDSARAGAALGGGAAARRGALPRVGDRVGGRAPLRGGAPGVPRRAARAGAAGGVRGRVGRAAGARRRVGRGGAGMGRGAGRGADAAGERRELARGSASRAAGADRARRPDAGGDAAPAPSRGRAAARLGPAGERLERLRADGGRALVRRGVRPAALRRPGGGGGGGGGGGPARGAAGGGGRPGGARGGGGGGARPAGPGPGGAGRPPR